MWRKSAKNPKISLKKISHHPRITSRIYLKKIYTVNSSKFLSPNVWADDLWSRNLCSLATATKRSGIFLFSGLSWKTNKVENSSRYFDGICWRIFLPKKQKTQSCYNVVQVLQVDVSFESTGRNSDKPKKINSCKYLDSFWILPPINIILCDHKAF